MHETNYPRVRCGAHGVGLGYLVCKHVIDGAMPKHHVSATSEQLGELDCGCAEDSEASTDNLKLVCARCAQRIRRLSEQRVLS